MEPPGDRELVERCLAGEEAAWSLLVGRYADLIHGIARRAGLGEDGAGDVVQEVGLALMKGLPRLRDRERLFPWVVKSARREAWRQVRRRRAAARREEGAGRPEEDRGESPEEEVLRLEEEQAVREALDAVGESCRRLLRALYFEGAGEAYDEVALRLGIPRGSIGPTRGRCLAKLREHLDRLGFGRAGEVSGRRAAASDRTEGTP